MDLLIAPGAKILIVWSWEDFYLIKTKGFLRTYGFLVSTRAQESVIAGLSQRVRILARLYNARQVYHARHYLAELRERLPFALPHLTREFWDFFSLKTDEADIKPYLLFAYAQEVWDGLNSHRKT